MSPLSSYGSSGLPLPASSSSNSAGLQQQSNFVLPRVTDKQSALRFTEMIQMQMNESLATLGEADEAEESNNEGEVGTDSSSGDTSDSSAVDLQAGFDASIANTLRNVLASGSLTASEQSSIAALMGQAGLSEQAQMLQGITSANAHSEALTGAGNTQFKQSVKENADTVARVARKFGVDPVLAVAMMLVESGGNNTAVGDGGTSFGLFQLHKGGMLTASGMSPKQAMNPESNALVAMKSLAHEISKGPNRSPGVMAASSQRPANPDEYAKKIQAAMAQAQQLIKQK